MEIMVMRIFKGFASDTSPLGTTANYLDCYRNLWTKDTTEPLILLQA